MTSAAIGHMPFPGHRNQREVREDEERKALARRLEKELKRGREEELKEELFYRQRAQR